VTDVVSSSSWVTLFAEIPRAAFIPEIIWVDGGTRDGHGWQPGADDIERAEISTTQCAAVIWIGCSIQPRAPSPSVRPQDLGQPPVKNNRTTSSLLNRWLAAG
jgi:hypothetical protein